MRGYAATALLLGVVTCGCSHEPDRASPSGTAAVDCSVGVRFQGTVYVEGGLVRQPAERLGTGEVSSCSDTGSDPRGSYFADDPPMVAVWSFPGHDPGEVLGVRGPDRRLRVLLAEDLSEAERRVVESELRRR